MVFYRQVRKLRSLQTRRGGPLSAEPPDLRKPAGRTLCPQAHPARANVRRGKAEEPLTGGGYHPVPGIPGLRTVISAPVTTMIAAPGAPLLAAEAHDEVQNPRHGPGTIRRYPIPAHRKQTAHRVTCQASTTATLPAELVTLIDLPCTPEVPGIHLPWTCAAPGESQRPRRRIRLCRNEYFIRAHIYVRSGIPTHALSVLPAITVRSFHRSGRKSDRIFTPATTVGRL